MENELNQEDKQVTPIEFSGSYFEYFKLWSVNLLLTIITLGIYGPWAKVRNLNYLYGHTKILDQGFRYLAKPMQILKGRILALVLMLLYSIAVQVDPIIAMVSALVLMALSPWMIVQGLKFSLKMTSYRNVRFSFTGNYIGALLAFVVYPMLSILTLFLAMPLVVKKMDQFIYSNIQLGGQQMDASELKAKRYFIAVLLSGLASIILIFLGISIALGFGGITNPDDTPSLVFLATVYVAMFFSMFIGKALYASLILVHILESIKLPEIFRFRPRIKLGQLLWLNLSNTLLLMGTLGLAYPLIVIRRSKFLYSNIDLELEPKAHTLANTVHGDQSAFADEAANAFDIDLSLT